MTQKRHSLRQILTKIKKFRAENATTLAVFDLDSTLFDVGPRVERIFAELIQEPHFNENFPHEIKKLANFKTHSSDWGVETMLLRVGVPRDKIEFYRAVHDYWHRRFFSNDYLKYDHPYAGAVEYVQKISALQSDIVYLTGRDVERMGLGTRQTLLHWGFPLDDQQSRLELKPHKTMDDASFKTEWFKVHHQNYNHVLFFENEPSNIHPITDARLPVEIIFFASTHSGRMHPPSEVLHISDFIHAEEETTSLTPAASRKTH